MKLQLPPVRRVGLAGVWLLGGAVGWAAVPYLLGGQDLRT